MKNKSFYSGLRQIARKTRFKAAPYPFRDPIFVIAPPRSGSTFLFDALSRLKGIVSLDYEADGIWWDLFPYDRQESPSDRIAPSEVDHSMRRSLRVQTYQLATVQTECGTLRSLLQRFGIYPIRYLDKTIANCFRVDVLRSVFPEAEFILLVRDPRANISSMIEGWSHVDRFGKPQLTPIIESISDATVEHWTYPAPPGWQEVVNRPLPEICAWSWKQHIEYALDFLTSSPPLVRVRYENLRDNPRDTLSRLASTLDTEITEDLKAFLMETPESDTTVSSPRRGKWRKKNEEAIRSILPMVRETAQRIGYEV